MSAFLVQMALSNLLVSGVLAAIAYAVHRRGRYPFLAHLLWILVLLKLVTPPLLSLPVARIPANIGLPPLAPNGAATSAASTFGPSSGTDVIVAGLLVTWAIGSLFVLAVSLWRIVRFDRLLRATSRPAPEWIQFVAEGAALRLGLEKAPRVYLTSARLSPMTWWIGGQVRVLLPQGLAQDIQSDQLAWVLGHELGHVKRRDHLVRWLEWIACVWFWWNPVAWWARQHLRLDEEAACDALVIDRMGPRPRTYARALLAVVEHLARPTLRPPAVATGIDGGGSLERRFRLIIASRGAKRTPRWLAIGLVASVMALLPLGFGVAADREPSVAGWVVRPANTVSASELAFLRGDQRVAAQQALASTLRDQARTTAMLSATVKTKGGARTNRTSATKVKRARNVKVHKATLRAKRTSAQRQAVRDTPGSAPERRVEQIGRSTPM